MKTQLRYWLSAIAILCGAVAVYSKILAEPAIGGIGADRNITAGDSLEENAPAFAVGSEGNGAAVNSAAVRKIASHFKVSAPVLEEDFPGSDPAMDALESGILIDVSVKEVAAAIAQAAKTPDDADDKEAAHLLHLARFRFFSEATP